MPTQYSLADFTVMVGTVSPADVDVSCATGTLTEGADDNMVDGIPVACAPYPPQVWGGARFTVQIDGAADDNVTSGLGAFLRANHGQAGVLELAPRDALNPKGLPSVAYDVAAWAWPAVTYPADGPAALSTTAMPLADAPTYTAAGP